MVIKKVSVTQKSNNVNLIIFRDIAFSGGKSVFFGGGRSRGVGASRSNSAIVGYFCAVVSRQ